jgi:hypothetical protein
MRRKLRRLGCYLVLLLVLACDAATDTISHPLSQPGTWDIAISLGQVIAQEYGRPSARSNLSMAGVQVGRVLIGPSGQGWIRGTLEYGFELVPFFETTSPQVVQGEGLDVFLLRWNLIGTPRLQPYFEAAGGAVITERTVPPGDTSHFNFVPKIGAGIFVYTRRRQAASLGLHCWHLSNGRLGDRNPALNGLELTIAYHWFR